MECIFLVEANDEPALKNCFQKRTHEHKAVPTRTENCSLPFCELPHFEQVLSCADAQPCSAGNPADQKREQLERKMLFAGTPGGAHPERSQTHALVKQQRVHHRGTEKVGRRFRPFPENRHRRLDNQEAEVREETSQPLRRDREENRRR